MFVYLTTNYCDDTYSFYLFLYPYVCFKQDSVKHKINTQMILYLSGGGVTFGGGRYFRGGGRYFRGGRFFLGLIAR